MKINKNTVASLFLVMALFAVFSTVTPVNAELTEAEKQAIETALKAAELAKETTKTTITTTTTATVKVQKAEISGPIQAISGNRITVAGKTVTVGANTNIVLSGAGLSKVSVTINQLRVGYNLQGLYNVSTNEFISIDAEVVFVNIAANYPPNGTGTVTFVGIMEAPGHWMFAVGNRGIKVSGATIITVNGALVPTSSNYGSIRVGDTVTFSQNMINLEAFWVEITR